MDLFNDYMFNIVKSGLRMTFCLPKKAFFKTKMLSLYRLYPYRKPRWTEVGQTYIHKRRNCTLWFWRHKNFATSNWLSKTKQRERLMRCIIYSHHWLRSILSSVVKEDDLYIYTCVGLSALLVSTIRAMRRPLWRGTSDRTGSALFCIYTYNIV